MNPEDRIKVYLNAHKSEMQLTTLDKAVGQVKLFVFFNASPIPDDAIRTIIAQWAMFNAPRMTMGPISVDPASDDDDDVEPANASEIRDAVKKALSVVNDGVTVGDRHNNINITVSGATANLKRGGGSGSFTMSWGGALQLKAQSGPFHFDGKLEKDKWEMSLSMPDDSAMPDGTKLGDVFTKGEKAVRNLANEAFKFSNIGDVKKISALVRPDLKDIHEATEALGDIDDQPKHGGYSFGVKVGSPDPTNRNDTDMPKGYQVTVIFSVWF